MANKGFLFLFLLTVIIRQIWIYSVIERDEGGIAIIALQWLQGLPPYINSLNNAGPLSYVIYTFSTYLFGTSMISIRLINNILFYFSFFIFFILVSNFFSKKIALFSSLFYGIFMSAPIYEGQLALTSSLSAPFVVFSIFFLSNYLQNFSRKQLFFAAFFLGSASLIKVHIAIGMVLLLIVVLLSYHWRASIRSSLKKVVTDIATLLLGFSFLSLIFLTYFWQIGAIDEILHIFFDLTLGGHLKLPDVPFGITFNVLIQGLPLWILSIIGAIAVLQANRKNHKHMILYCWGLFAVILAVFPPHFGHRYIYIIAPGSVFAGIGFNFALRTIAKRIKPFKLSYDFIIRLIVVIFLTLSFIPSLYFQIIQYPQYHINSESLNLQWRYADADNYETQINVSEFLQNNTSEDEQIFIHTWGGIIYYFSNRLPPSIYVWTVPGIGADIPEDEYDRLIEKIRQTNFSYVVIFDSNLEAIRHRDWDPVVELTLRKYFFVGNIDNAQIFGKFNSLNEYKYFDFIEKFSLAAETYYTDDVEGDLGEDFNGSIFLPIPSKLKILGNERDTIFHHPITNGNSSLSYSLFIPKNSTLQFGIGLDPEVWNETTPSNGVEFMVQIKINEEERTIFSRFVNPNNLTDQRWHNFRLDLEEFANNDAIISFITSPGPEGNSGYDWAHWSDPVILVRKEEGRN